MAIWFNGAACGAIVTSALIALLLAMAVWNRRLHYARAASARLARNLRGVSDG